MANQEPILIVDTFKKICANVDKVIFPQIKTHVAYHYGSSIAILKTLTMLNEGITTKNRFPLIALFQPFEEVMGGNGYYTQLKIGKIVIAMLTNSDRLTPDRYKETFIPILYPIYYEFINQIANNGNFIINDPGLIIHTKMDNPGSPPPPPKDNAGFNEYVDAIEIRNLELTYYSQSKCN